MDIDSLFSCRTKKSVFISLYFSFLCFSESKMSCTAGPVCPGALLQHRVEEALKDLTEPQSCWFFSFFFPFDACICVVREVKSLNPVRPFATPWTVACQPPPSMGFCRQENWSGLPFPSPGDLPDPGTEPGPPALQAVSLPSELTGKPIHVCIYPYMSVPSSLDSSSM